MSEKISEMLDYKCQTKYPKCWIKLHVVGLKYHFVGLNCTFLKENPLKLSEILKQTTFSKENVLVLR
jgi:hypothetical protein